MATTYEIICDNGSLYPESSGPIKSARTAKAEAKSCAQNAKPGEKIYIQWHRDGDQQTGYLNPDGNDITGRPWN